MIKTCAAYFKAILSSSLPISAKDTTERPSVVSVFGRKSNSLGNGVALQAPMEAPVCV